MSAVFSSQFHQHFTLNFFVRALRSFFSHYVIFWSKNFGAKGALNMWIKFQFHQHFKRDFFTDILLPKKLQSRT